LLVVANERSKRPTVRAGRREAPGRSASSCRYDPARVFASVRCYFVHRAPASELARRVDEDFAGRIGARPGFVSYEFIDGGGGDVMSISVFEDAAQAEASRELARGWTEERLTDLELTVTEALHGEVAISRAALDTSGGRSAGVRRYRVGEVGEVLRAVGAGFVERLAVLDGFSSYRVIDCGGGELLSISVFGDSAQASASDRLAERFVEEELVGIGVQRVEIVGGGEIVVSRR
jgi:hypothetical protein